MHQHTAQGLASLGRNGDSMLVHMTPREVQGLQSLAMAHGGSLTINPKTGLPEASILGSLLPTLFGVGLNALFPGLGAVGAGLITGGLTTMASGNLKQGLMAGLGAYGGAGLGESLFNAGATAPVAAAPKIDPTIYDYPVVAANNAAATTAAAAQQAAGPAAWGELDAGPAAISTKPDSMQRYSSAVTNTLIPTVTPDGNIVDTSVINTTPEAFGKRLTMDDTSARLGQMGQGVKNVFTDPTTGKQFFKDNWMTIGSAFASPAMEAMKQQPFLPPAKEAQKYANYGYTSERNPYFGQPGQPYYIQRYSPVDYSTTFRAAEGGVISPNDNKMYPMSNLAAGKAGFNVQSSPTSNEVVGGYDARIDPFTGQQMMAAGGAVQHYLSGGAARKAAETMYSDQAGMGPYSDSAGAGPYSDAAEEGPYTNSDMNKGLEAQFRKMAPSTLARYKKAKNAAMQAAAIKEEYARSSAPLDYDDTDIKMAVGGIASLPEYAAGGKLLRGAGDGMSDDIPAVIKGAKPQRAALADGEFVVPADVVSHLGNGSTEAGAKRLYSMMAKVRKARTGNPKQGKQIVAEKYMPA